MVCPSTNCGIYTQDPAVFNVALYLLLFAMAYQLMDAWQVGAAGCLRGMQDTKADVDYVDCLLGDCISSRDLSGTGCKDGYAGVWLGLIIGLSIACVLLLARLYSNNRKLAAQP